MHMNKKKTAIGLCKAYKINKQQARIFYFVIDVTKITQHNTRKTQKISKCKKSRAIGAEYIRRIIKTQDSNNIMSCAI